MKRIITKDIKSKIIKERLEEMTNKKVILKEYFHKDFIKGGKGDKLKPEDVDQKELAKGIKVEMEHTNDKKIAKEIALDHLAENPKYYTKLSKVHKEKYD